MPRTKRIQAASNESLIPPDSLAAAARMWIPPAIAPALSLVPKPGNGNGNGNGGPSSAPALDPFEFVVTTARVASSWFDMLAINAQWMSNAARVLQGQKPE